MAGEITGLIPGRDVVLTEFEPLDEILQQLPKKALGGLITYEQSLTSITAKDNYIFVGTNLGVVYAIEKICGVLGKLQVQNRTHIVTALNLLWEYDYLACGSSKGSLTIHRLRINNGGVFEIGRKQIQSYHVSDIKCITWSPDGKRMFAGDASGKVSVTVVDFSQKKLSTKVLLHEDSAIVQLDFANDQLLVSSKMKCLICHCSTVNFDNVTIEQVGSKARKSPGDFGACFWTNDEEPFIYAGRPGLRLWKANMNGKVHTTIVFKEPIAKGSYPPIAILGTYSSVANAVNIESLQFGQLRVFNNQFICSWYNHHLWVIDPVKQIIIGGSSEVGNVIDIALTNNDIYILRIGNERSLVQISLALSVSKVPPPTPSLESITIPTVETDESNDQRVEVNEEHTSIGGKLAAMFSPKSKDPANQDSVHVEVIESHVPIGKKIAAIFGHKTQESSDDNLHATATIEDIPQPEVLQVIRSDEINEDVVIHRSTRKKKKRKNIKSKLDEDAVESDLHHDGEVQHSSNLDNVSTTKLVGFGDIDECKDQDIAIEPLPDLEIVAKFDDRNLEEGIEEKSWNSLEEELKKQDIQKSKEDNWNSLEEELREQDNQYIKEKSFTSLEEELNEPNIIDKKMTTDNTECASAISFVQLHSESSKTQNSIIKDDVSVQLNIGQFDDNARLRTNNEEDETKSVSNELEDNNALTAMVSSQEVNKLLEEINITGGQKNKEDHHNATDVESTTSVSELDAKESLELSYTLPAIENELLAEKDIGNEMVSSKPENMPPTEAVKNTEITDNVIDKPVTTSSNLEAAVNLGIMAIAHKDAENSEGGENKRKSNSDTPIVADNWSEYAGPGGNYLEQTFSPMNHISASHSLIWCTDKSERIFYMSTNTTNRTWCKIDGYATYVVTSASGNTVWCVNNRGVAGYRTGIARLGVPVGKEWHFVDEFKDPITCLSVSDFGVWATTRKHFCLSRLGREEAVPGGVMWHKVSSGIISVACYDNIVWAINQNNEVLVRQNVTQNCTVGDSWLKLPDIKATYVSLQDCMRCIAWIIDCNGRIMYTRGVTVDNPSGNKKWYQISLGTFQVPRESSLFNSLLSPFAKKNDLKVVTATSGAGVCVLSCNGSMYIAHGSVTGSDWGPCSLVGVAKSARWKLVSASSHVGDDGLVWVVQQSNELFTINDRNRLNSISIPCPIKDIYASVDGVWAVTNDGRLLIRTNINRHNREGDGWNVIDLLQIDNVPMVSVSCGIFSVWAVDSNGSVWYRTGVIDSVASASTTPAWLPVDSQLPGGCRFTSICVSPGEWMIWACDNKKNVYVRTGVMPDFPIGADWEHVQEDAPIVSVAISNRNVWAICPDGSLLCRYGITPNNAAGNYWKKVPGTMSRISVSPSDELWAIDKNGYLLRRDLDVLNYKVHSGHDASDEGWEYL